MKINIEFSSLDELEALLTRLRVFEAPVSSPPQQRTEIDTLDLSVRTLNCLKAESIETVEQLCTWTENELLRTPNLGRRALNEIKEVLSHHGLALAYRPEVAKVKGEDNR